jgi:hypothetical protein
VKNLGEPTHSIFLSLVPENHSREYLATIQSWNRGRKRMIGASRIVKKAATVADSRRLLFPPQIELSCTCSVKEREILDLQYKYNVYNQFTWKL